MSSDLTASLAFGLCRPSDVLQLMTQHRQCQRQRLLLLLSAAAVHLARLVKFSFLSHLLWPLAIGGLGLEGNGNATVLV